MKQTSESEHEDDRPVQLIELLAHLERVMPPLSEEEEAAIRRWRIRMSNHPSNTDG